LPDLQGGGACGREAFLLTSAFGYFCRDKSDKASAATERNHALFEPQIQIFAGFSQITNFTSPVKNPPTYGQTPFCKTIRRYYGNRII
jgi:hypothetical protein